MIDDPIIEELRKHKAELAEEYNNDFWLLAEALNEEADSLFLKQTLA